MYLSPDPDEQRTIFMKHGLSREHDAERVKKGEQPQRWVFPLGFIKWKPAVGPFFSSDLRKLTSFLPQTEWFVFLTTHEVGSSAILFAPAVVCVRYSSIDCLLTYSQDNPYRCRPRLYGFIL